MRVITGLFALTGILLFADTAYACSVRATGSFQSLVATVCWIAGTGLGISSVLNLRRAKKQAVEGRWDKARLKRAKWRFALCVVLLLYPFVYAEMNTSIADGPLVKITPPPGQTKPF